MLSPVSRWGEGWCARETQLAKVMRPEQSWDRSPLLGPQQVPVQAAVAPYHQTGFIRPCSAQSRRCGTSAGAPEGQGAAGLSVEVYPSPYGGVQNTQFTQNCELCLTIFNTKNANGNCHLI